VFCPNCESEYREGITRCADCDCNLVAELDEDAASPIDTALAPLTTEASFTLVSELVDRLEKARVPYVIEAGTALALLSNPDADMREPDDWAAHIYVASAFSARAERILTQIRDGIQEDGDDSDDGG